MEQDIKNFDRTIEQIMNEQQVAPPFGMWNRISAELETVPVAAPTTVIPKRAIVGIIAAVLMIGATVTGYMVNSFMNKDKVANTGNPVVAIKVAAIQTPQAQPLNSVRLAIPAPVKNNPVAVVLKKHVETVAAVKENETKGAEETTPVVIAQTLPVNGNTDVPTPIQPVAMTIAGENPTYYFPPVDMNIPEKSKGKVGHAVAKADDEDDDSDKKTKLISSNDNRVKFHPKKHTKFSYGSIIHTKK